MKTRTIVPTVAAALVLGASIVLIAASPAFAAACGNGQGQPWLIGCNNNTATDDTVLTNSRANGAVLLLTATGPGNTTGLSAVGSATGVYANGDTAVYAQGGHTGVFGFGTLSGSVGVSGQGSIGVFGASNVASDGKGVRGEASGANAFGVDGSNANNVGVHGVGGVAGVQGDSTGGGNGVYGHANNNSASGVYGQNDGAGYGVAGRGGVGVFGDSGTGIGVQAHSFSGTALEVDGTSVFSRSGLVGISAGSKSATVTGVPLSAQSLVLATVQNNAGVWVKFAAPNIAGSQFTITLNKAVPVGKTALVAWFIVN
jgi:hypothetical protein